MTAPAREEELAEPIKVLRLLLTINETGAPYNQFSLAQAGRQRIAICTYFPSRVEPPPTLTVFEGDGTLAGFFRGLRAALRAGPYDVVHAHSPHVGLFYLLASLLPGASLRGTVFTAHNSYENFKFRNKLLLLAVFVSFQRVVCCGQASLESFPWLFRRLAGKRLDAVANGVDLERIDRVTRSRPRAHGGSFQVVSVGRLVPVKDPGCTLSAFAAAGGEHARLTFVGAGGLRETLLARAGALGVAEQVVLAGQIGRDPVFEQLAAADLFVSTSRGEGLPVAPLEAMACGCPVLLSDIPPHREIAAGVDYVPLIAPGDVPGFAREIRRVMKLPAAEREEIGRRCRRLVQERFSLGAMHRGYARIYRELMAQ